MDGLKPESENKFKTMKFFPDKAYRDKVRAEQNLYNTGIVARVLRNESWLKAKYLYYMRYVEWYDLHKSLFVNKIIRGGLTLFLYHFGRQTGLQIGLHSCDFGVKIYHWGWCIVNQNARIGKNVVMYPGVCVGQTSSNAAPIIGDNVFIGLSSKVMGPIRVGNNVIIAPNAVVTKDVPDNAVVAGVPAKVIKMRNIDYKQ
jgi:serine O-acetyltransferase